MDKKRFGRRALSATVWLIAAYSALFLPSYAHVPESLVSQFIISAKEVLFVVVFGLTATDVVNKWKEPNNGNGK